MGIYYGYVLGVRILRQIHTEAEYSEDYETVWEYEGPYWRELAKAKLHELADDSLLLETKHNTNKKECVWLSYTGL